MNELKGKVALVTGGSRGLGAAAARALAAQGADVAISYVASEAKAQAVVRELEAQGVHSAAFQTDQADAAQVEQLIARVVQQFGRLDILVNNAGVFETGTIDTADTSAFDRQFAVNVGGTIAAIRAASKVMGDGGRIITIGSQLSTRVSQMGMADYAASKGAVTAYSKGAARDLGSRNITVNVIQAGAFDTDLNPADSPYAGWQKEGSALNRFGRPEELAAGVVFLAGPAASFVTGSVLTIDGGSLA